MRPREGDLVNGKYRLVRLIGDGGMGTVFEARHEHLGTAVALKFLHPDLAKRQQLVARFVQEAQLSATIKSHHIAHVTDIDQSSDGNAYIVMELLQGDSLQTILDRDKKIPLHVALDYTLQILAGLEAAHDRGVVHRDLKPDNVFVIATPRGPLVKLLDFGIAKLRTSNEFQVGLTRPGVMMGTPEYMAPEQAFSAEAVDARADVYSVGTMLYEMLAGVRPTQGEDAQQIAAFLLAGKVIPLHTKNPEVPEGVSQAVQRAMAAKPEDRFASAPELRAALLPYVGALSLAGQLAATPSPSGGVAPTLPPGPDEPPPPAATEPRTPITATPGGLPYTPPGAAYTPPTPGYAAQTPWQAPPTPAASPYGYQPIEAAPTRARSRPRGFSGWLLVGVLVAAGAAAAAAIMLTSASDDGHGQTLGTPTIATTTPTAPTSTAAAAPTPPPTIAPPIQPATTPVATSPTTHPATKPKSDGGSGADAGPAASTTPPVFTVPGFPPIPFPLPSAIPMPPLPSGFPAIPGLPGFPPASPAPSH
jgi:serine/threonine-protein kinase